MGEQQRVTEKDERLVSHFRVLCLMTPITSYDGLFKWHVQVIHLIWRKFTHMWTHTHTLTHSHTHSLTHSHTHTLTHSHTHTLTHSLTLTHTHVCGCVCV